MSLKVDISIIVPLFNEEESLTELVTWISKVMLEYGYSWEALLIDDGSTDKSWEVITKLSGEYRQVKGIKFNRNYGKSAALNTGFKACKGRVVITMDADLQDSPDEIPVLYKRIQEDGFDLVSGWKRKRYDPITKTIPSKFFNAVTSYMSGIKLHDFNCGLKAYRGNVVKTLEVHGEMHRYIPVIAKWNGFRRIGEQVVQHRARKYGVTKFGWERFVYGFLDLMSIMFVSKFRKRPMHFFGLLGSLSFFTGFLITGWLVIEKLWLLQHGLRARNVTDQPLFFLALVAIIIGVQLFLAGFLGELLSRLTQKQNEYLVAETVSEGEINFLLEEEDF